MTLDLVFENLVIINGGYLGSGGANPDLVGYAQMHTHPNKPVKYWSLAPGSYGVTFKEAPVNVSTPTLYEVIQPDLIGCGAFLVLNKEPFKGLLVVTRSIIIDENTKVATLHYENFTMSDEPGEPEDN